jgi:hypothetical protein
VAAVCAFASPGGIPAMRESAVSTGFCGGEIAAMVDDLSAKV